CPITSRSSGTSTTRRPNAHRNTAWGSRVPPHRTVIHASPNSSWNSSVNTSRTPRHGNCRTSHGRDAPRTAPPVPWGAVSRLPGGEACGRDRSEGDRSSGAGSSGSGSVLSAQVSYRSVRGRAASVTDCSRQGTQRCGAVARGGRGAVATRVVGGCQFENFRNLVGPLHHPQRPLWHAAGPGGVGTGPDSPDEFVVRARTVSDHVELLQCCRAFPQRVVEELLCLPEPGGLRRGGGRHVENRPP